MKAGKKEFNDKCKNVIEQNKFEQLKDLNPFLFNNNYPDTYFVIEDFYINYKNDYIKFEELIRTDDVSFKDKKRAISNQISEWEKEAELKIFETFNESKEIILKCRVNKLYKFGIKNYLFLISGIIVSILFLLNIIPVSSIIKIDSKPFVITLLGISVLGIIIAISKGRTNRKFIVSLNKQKINHDFLSRKILKKLSKTANKVRKYYLKKYKDNIFMKNPLLIDNINYVGKKLVLFKKTTIELDKLNEKVSNISRKKTEQKLAIFISFLTLFISVSYVLLAIAMIIIEKMK